MRTKTGLLLFFFLLLLVASQPPVPAQAATISVTTTDDEVNSDGDCSLREAIIAANSDSLVDACPAGDGADFIDLPAGTYTLTRAGINNDDGLLGDLDVTDELTITGAGRAATIIDANGVDRALHLHESAGSVEISRLTVRGGHPVIPGAVYVFGSNLQLINTRVRDNAGTGAVYVTHNGTLTVNNTRIYDNTSGGLLVGVTASATVLNSLISGNGGHPGAGINNSGNLAVVNSTVSGNSTSDGGGGLRNGDPLASTTLLNTTITDNTANSDGIGVGRGGGLDVDWGTTTVWNSIIAGNVDGSSVQHPDCSGNLVSEGYNLIQSTTGCTISGDTASNITGADPMLDLLQNNGGPTLTHALLNGSPAIDAGNPNGCQDAQGALLRTDQRDYVRPVDGGGGIARCDIGAFEYASGGPRPATLVVERTSNFSDRNPGDGRCDISVNAGDQCGLRAALEEVNALGPGGSPIHVDFNISGSGPHTITPASPLPAITAPIYINGASQPGATCPTTTAPAALQIVLDGSNAGNNTSGLVLNAGSDGSTIRGLVVGAFQLHGIEIKSDGNTVHCNYLGLAADGISPMGNDAYGLWLVGHDNLVGDPSAGARRNVISANQTGITIYGDRNEIAGNFVGTTADGLGALGNFDGIDVVGGSRNFLGFPPGLLIQPYAAVSGAAGIGANVISANTRFGVHLSAAQDNLVLGNLIGVARDGVTPLPNGSGGIRLLKDSTGNTIGQAQPGHGNIIAHNGAAGGVIVLEDGGLVPTRNSIQGNAIHGNQGLGIDLGTSGVLANDDGDGDGGENEGQNYPILQTVPGSAAVSGTLDSQPQTTYEIDIYRNGSCDPSGHGQGQEYLYTQEISTDGNGQSNFSISFPAGAVLPGDYITATATDPDRNTSEFSACVQLDFVPQDTPTPTATATIGPTPTPLFTPPPPDNSKSYLPYIAN